MQPIFILSVLINNFIIIHFCPLLSEIGMSCRTMCATHLAKLHLNVILTIRGSCKKFCHWVRITSLLRFIKHIFITNLQSIPPLLKHIFVTYLPSCEKQINSLINSAAKRTSRRILISRQHFLKALEIKRSHRDSGQVNKVDGLKLSPFQKPKKT